MLRLTFTDAKNQTRVVGESESIEELYAALQSHAKRLFIHPTVNMAPKGIEEEKGWFIVANAKDGCRYMLENVGATEPKTSAVKAAGCNVCNTI